MYLKLNMSIRKILIFLLILKVLRIVIRKKRRRKGKKGRKEGRITFCSNQKSRCPLLFIFNHIYNMISYI